MLDNFFTWEYLASFAGVVVLVALIIEFTKMPLDKVWKIPTRLFLWVISYLILCIVAYFTAKFTVEYIVLSLFNAIIVAWTAIGFYESIIKKLEESIFAVFKSKPPNTGA